MSTPPTYPPSKIGIGRPGSAACGSTPASSSISTTTGVASIPRASTPSCVTPEAYRTTTPTADQQLPLQTGHSAVTPCFNITPSRPQPAEQPQQTSVPSSKWKSTNSTSGPVFSVVSRGSRLPAGNLAPPAPPTKAHATAPRTTNRQPLGRSTSASSAASMSLRGNRSTPSTASSGSSSSMAFGSKRTIGRFSSTSSSSNSSAGSSMSCSTPVASSCNSVARVLSFEDEDAAGDTPEPQQASSYAPNQATGGPRGAATAATAPTGRSTSAAVPIIPAGAAAGEQQQLQHPRKAFGKAAAAAAGSAGFDDDAACNDVVCELDQLTQNSSSSHTNWLSGNNGSLSPLLDFEQPCSTAPFACMLRSSSAPTAAPRMGLALPAVHDAASAQAAAKVLLAQLLQTAGSLTAAAGLPGDAAAAAILGEDSSSSSNGQGFGEGVHQAPGPAGEGCAVADVTAGSSSSRNGSSSSGLSKVLFDQAAIMLEAGASAEVVGRAVMPVLLLQLAGLACTSSSSAVAAATDAAAGSSAGHGGEVGCDGDGLHEGSGTAAAAHVMMVGVKAGIEAAAASMLHYTTTGEASTAAAAAALGNSNAAAVSGGVDPIAATGGKQGSSSSQKQRGSRCSKGLVGVLLLLWSSLLLVVGFVAAAVLSVLEGGSWLGVSPAGDGIAVFGAGDGAGGFGGMYHGSAGVGGWGAAAVQHGRRFGA